MAVSTGAAILMTIAHAPPPFYGNAEGTFLSYTAPAVQEAPSPTDTRGALAPPLFSLGICIRFR